MRNYRVVFYTGTATETVDIEADSHSVKDGILGFWNDTGCVATFLHWSYVTEIQV